MWRAVSLPLTTNVKVSLSFIDHQCKGAVFLPLTTTVMKNLSFTDTNLRGSLPPTNTNVRAAVLGENIIYCCTLHSVLYTVFSWPLHSVNLYITFLWSLQTLFPTAHNILLTITPCSLCFMLLLAVTDKLFTLCCTLQPPDCCTVWYILLTSAFCTLCCMFHNSDFCILYISNLIICFLQARLYATYSWLLHYTVCFILLTLAIYTLYCILYTSDDCTLNVMF